VYGEKLINAIKLGVIVSKIILNLLVIFLGICLIALGYQLNTLINNKECNVYYFDLKEHNIETAKGVYYHEDFFCVITKNRTNENIIRTTVHELAHLLIETDEKHFLERYKEE
jgi:Zn-dependent peptidase ImmA (M78 family)